jgi:hypothetical protein
MDEMLIRQPTFLPKNTRFQPGAPVACRWFFFLIPQSGLEVKKVPSRGQERAWELAIRNTR